MATNDQIRLVLPADAEYGRIARIAAAGLALRLGFTYREIEDLRLAIDETIILLLRPLPVEDADDDEGGRPTDAERQGIDGDLTITFVPGTDRIVVEAVAEGVDGHPTAHPERRERFSAIVGPAVDEFSVDEAAGTVRLVKHHVHT